LENTAPEHDDQKKQPLVVSTQQEKQPHVSVMQKKKHFFAFMKPIVVAQNNAILKQRLRIMALKHNKSFNARQRAELQSIAKQYGVKFPASPRANNWQQLLERVDIIPVELALVQAANESAWGTSFFARQGNNYFGQWCFRKGCGIVPRRRNANATHEVKRFNNATASVHAYMKNINTSPSYAALRKIRRQLRLRHIPIHAETLTRGLKHYSERGGQYLKILRHMIRSNRKLMSQAQPLSR